MKIFQKSILFLFALLSANFAYSQTIVYANTVLAVSNEYATSDASCSNGWAACRILGAPDAYPACGDNANAWAYPCSQQREWIEVGFSTQLYVDTVRIYETYTSGAIDTVYLRNAQTGFWNTVYASPSTVGLTSCNVKNIFMATTSYKVDAVRMALNIYTGYCFPEIDAVALIGSSGSATGLNENSTTNTAIFPNPTTGNITVNTDGIGTSTIYIYDVLGQVAFSKTISQQTANFSLNLPSGVYFSVIIKNGKQKTEKIVIQ